MPAPIYSEQARERQPRKRTKPLIPIRLTLTQLLFYALMPSQSVKHFSQRATIIVRERDEHAQGHVRRLGFQPAEVHTSGVIHLLLGALLHTPQLLQPVCRSQIRSIWPPFNTIDSFTSLLFLMSDVQVQTIRVIIDVELRERTPSTAPPTTSDPKVVGHAYEQALFAALRADPARYADFIKAQIVSMLEVYGVNTLFAELAQLHDTYTASILALEGLLPAFSEPAQAYLQESISKGWITEGEDSIFSTVQATPVRLTVEYPPKPA
jgi:hypothetical protein